MRVPEAGVEPARSKAPRDFESLASASSATPAAGEQYSRVAPPGQGERDYESPGRGATRCARTPRGGKGKGNKPPARAASCWLILRAGVGGKEGDRSDKGFTTKRRTGRDGKTYLVRKTWGLSK